MQRELEQGNMASDRPDWVRTKGGWLALIGIIVHDCNVSTPSKRGPLT